MIDSTVVRTIQDGCEEWGNGVRAAPFRALASILRVAVVTAASGNLLGAQEVHCLPDLCIRPCTIPSLSDPCRVNSLARVLLLTNLKDSLFLLEQSIARCQFKQILFSLSSGPLPLSLLSYNTPPFPLLIVI